MLRFLLVFLGLIALCSPTVSLAAELNGLTVSPALNQMVVQSTQPNQSLAVTYTNHTSTSMDLEVLTQDFGGLEGTGGLFFLGAESNKVWDKHRLTPWLQVSPATFRLEPGQRQIVTVTIRNDQSLSPGGHYAAVTARLQGQSTDSTLTLNPAVSSLMFVNKKGGEVLGLSAQSLAADISWLGLADKVTVTFTNTGNSHVVPRGQIVVTDPFDRQISRGVVNQQSTILLPNTKQPFTTQLTRTHWPLWPGRYTLTLQYRYDGLDTPLIATKQTWVLGFGPLIAVALIIIGLVAWQYRRRQSS